MVSYHEGRVEPNPKLTNDGAAGLRLTLQSVQKGLGCIDFDEQIRTCMKYTTDKKKVE